MWRTECRRQARADSGLHAALGSMTCGRHGRRAALESFRRRAAVYFQYHTTYTKRYLNGSTADLRVAAGAEQREQCVGELGGAPVIHGQRRAWPQAAEPLRRRLEYFVWRIEPMKHVKRRLGSGWVYGPATAGAGRSGPRTASGRRP
jgi:hypothetical protein